MKFGSILFSRTSWMLRLRKLLSVASARSAGAQCKSRVNHRFFHTIKNTRQSVIAQM